MRPPALALAFVLLAGCITGTPEERARRALDDFPAEIGPTGGTLAHLNGTVSSNGYSVPFTYDVARDGTRHFNLTYGPIAFDIYCKGDQVVRIVGGVPTLQRPGPCPLDGSRFGAPLAALNQTNVTSAHGKGNDVIATFSGTNASIGGIVITADRRDRVTHVELHSPNGNLTANATYGTRAGFHMPEATARAALTARNYTYLYEGNMTWEAEDVSQNASLADLEVRVLDGATHARIATFRMGGGPQEDGGFSFTFADKDGDGQFSQRDTFWLVRPNWTRESDYQVQVYDTWADAPVVRSNGIPGPGIASVLAGIAVVALVARRSRASAPA
ncbi:MAG: hypothetical protein QOE90_2647 [Thermoplasmata archaeon]|nr:hypothetical protein [Thermoplasmata archaeon]